MDHMKTYHAKIKHTTLDRRTTFRLIQVALSHFQFTNLDHVLWRHDAKLDMATREIDRVNNCEIVQLGSGATLHFLWSVVINLLLHRHC